MEIDLAYIDYYVVGLTLNNTLKSFQSAETKQRSKFAIADQDGILQVFSIKNDEIQLNFKTLPGEPITTLDIGVSQNGCYDKIFVSSGTEVKGYSKKGKLFLSLETNLSEPIITMKVFESDLLVGGEHCMTHYRDCKDIGSYICGDRIVDIAAIRIQNSNRVVAMVACQGGVVHAIERGRVLAVVKLPTGPSLLFSAPTTVNNDFVFYGSVDGSIYSLFLDREHGSIEARTFTGIKQISCITAVGWWNRQNDNSVSLLLLGHIDGFFQIYNLKTDTPNLMSQLLFTYKFDESISSVAGWHKGIIVATHSGRIMGLTAPMDTNLITIKLNKLKEEIQELEVRVDKERSQYRIATQPLSQGLSAIPMLQINNTWGTVENDGTRLLRISLGAPLDILLIQSDASLLLLDSSPNTALLTKAFQTKGRNKLLATYRCQANTQEIEMRIGVWNETIESAGKLSIYITPLLQPKCCQLLKYQVAPLFWHIPIEEFDENREYSCLTVSGAISRVEIHAWLSFLLPEVPNRSQTSVSTIFYKSIIDTQLSCTYQKGEAIFKAENVSTIAIIKEFLSLEATKKKIQLDMSCNVNNKAIFNVLEKIHPKILNQFEKSYGDKIINALSEIQASHESDENFCKEYRNLLNYSSNMDIEKTLQFPQYCDIITNLYIDGNKLKGYILKNKVLELKEILNNYDIVTVKKFFENSFSSPVIE